MIFKTHLRSLTMSACVRSPGLPIRDWKIGCIFRQNRCSDLEDWSRWLAMAQFSRPHVHYRYFVSVVYTV